MYHKRVLLPHFLNAVFPATGLITEVEQPEGLGVDAGAFWGEWAAPRVTSRLCAGAGLSGRQVHRTQAVFNHTEDYVLLPDERTISLCCWDSRTAERRNLLSLGHNNIVRCIVHSPTNPGFMTCSDDFRARFWYRRSTTD